MREGFGKRDPASAPARGPQRLAGWVAERRQHMLHTRLRHMPLERLLLVDHQQIPPAAGSRRSQSTCRAGQRLAVSFQTLWQIGIQRAVERYRACWVDPRQRRRAIRRELSVQLVHHLVTHLLPCIFTGSVSFIRNVPNSAAAVSLRPRSLNGLFCSDRCAKYRVKLCMDGAPPRSREAAPVIEHISKPRLTLNIS